MSSKRNPLSLFLVRLSPAIWLQFLRFYQKRKLDYRPQMAPPHGVWVSDGLRSSEELELPLPVYPEPGWGENYQAPRLVAGCCIYPCEGPFAVIEYVSTNPDAPARTRYRAIEKMAQSIGYYGALVGKTPLCFPIDKSIERVMRKFGYNDAPKVRKVMWGPLAPPVYYDPGHENGILVTDAGAEAHPEPG